MGRTRIVLTSWQSVGCTFMDWSLHWLAGQDHYQHATKGKIPLVEDPLGSINAHGHIRNHPCGFDACKKYITALDSVDGMVSMYPTGEHIDTVATKLDFTIEQLQDSECYTQVKQEREQDYQRMIDLCNDAGWKIVFVGADARSLGYFWTVRDIDRFLSRSTVPSSTQEREREFQEIFFQRSIGAWNESGLSHVWDQRERMALDLRPFDLGAFYSPKLPFPHLWYNCQSVWNDPESVMLDILDQSEISLDASRLDSWRSVAHRWQGIQSRSAEFWNELPHIIACIINGWHYTLPRFTLVQEAIIQHCMIYHHGLNFRTWNLEHFPDNTKKLHDLLEPNIHAVEISARSIDSLCSSIFSKSSEAR